MPMKSTTKFCHFEKIILNFRKMNHAVSVPNASAVGINQYQKVLRAITVPEVITKISLNSSLRLLKLRVVFLDARIATTKRQQWQDCPRNRPR